MEGFNIRLDQVKKGSVKIKYRAVEIFQSEEQKEKRRMEKSENCFRDL